MSTSTSTYLPFNYSYGGFGYTGTVFQPDTLSLFVKKEQGSKLLIHHTEPVVNLVAKWLPLVGSMAGVLRIVQAVWAIFQHPFQQDQVSSGGLWNAFKNLVRGIVECCPGSGICLILFDAQRKNVVIHSNIGEEIADKQNIAGIAMDGKVIFTVDLASLQNASKFELKSDVNYLNYFTNYSLFSLKGHGDRGNSYTMPQIFAAIQNSILNPQPRVAQDV